MAIQTSNKTVVAEVVDNSEVVNLSKVADDERKKFDLSTSRSNYELEIKNSGIIDKLTSQIDLNNTTSIIEFGKEPAQQMAQIADQVLSKYDSATIDDTSKLVNSLLEVMKKIDIGEIKSLQELSATAKKSFFDRFKESAQEKLNRLVGKYKSIGSEMEQICNQLTVYEQQIKNSNNDIAKMYDAAKEEYKQLVATIMAAEQACVEIAEYRDAKQKEFKETGNPDLQFEIQNVSQALTLMELRTADLRGSEAVALQSIPTFKIQEVTNANLARKINSAFIITLPAFKSALVNSVIAKQQSIQAQGLAALDEATSVLVRKNADNAVNQLQMSQKLANTSAVKAEDIEYAWNTIIGGIQQYKEMEKQYSEIRKEEAKRIRDADSNYLQRLADGSSL